MSANFNNIPIRKNLGNVDASWWNTVKVAGAAVEALVNALQSQVAGIVGTGGTTSETQFSLAAGATAATLTGLILASTARKYSIKYWARITDGTINLMEVGTIIAWWNGTAWSFAYEFRAGDEFLTLAPDDTTGQFTYSTPNGFGILDSANSKIGYSLTTQG